MVTLKATGASRWEHIPPVDLRTHYVTKKYRLLALVWHVLVVYHQTFKCGQCH